VSLRRQRVTTPDDDFLDLDWVESDEIHAGAPASALVIVLHGLEGSARSGYALEAYRQLAARGMPAVGLNFRSCSGELNRAPRLYHSGETEDLRFVVEMVRARYPDVALGAVGFSLGGNVLLKYLAEAAAAGRTPLAAAAAVSVPFDLAAGADHTERGLTRLYVYRLLRSLRHKVRARAAELCDRLDVPAALAARTFRTFDDAATAPLHGFRNADDYYARSSSGPRIPEIRTPTLLVHAADDPFLPAGAIPRAAVAANRWLCAHFTDRGGHVGFVTGHPWRRRYWAEARVATFLADHLDAQREPAANLQGR
jgi:predicted alpha/beta-fold hydrolase